MSMACKEVVPPFRFAHVCCAIGGSDEETLYRGAYPSLRNFAFLKTLGLKTLVSFLKGGQKNLSLDLVEFCRSEGINLMVVELGEEKKIPSSAALKQVVAYLINKTNLPAYVHCSDGGVSTGALVMCIRLLQRWSWDSAASEYCRYVKDGSMSSDIRNLVSSFPLDTSQPPHLCPSWLSTPEPS